MENAQPSVEEREQRLDEIVTAYLKAVEQGQKPDCGEWLDRHPDLASELQEFFHKQNRLEQMAAPLREGLALADEVGDETKRPELLGDFRIVREAGRGGMGVVYEAEQMSLRRRVALKVLPFAATMDSRHLQRFRNETLAAASLHHGNIVPVYFVGCERGVHFYAMQFIPGCSLAAVLRELRGESGKAAPAEKPATPADEAPTVDHRSAPGSAETVALAGLSTQGPKRSKEYFRSVAQLGVQIAEALDYAHERGVIHRDVKPANILVDEQGLPWLTDFGLAHLEHSEASLTITGDLVGTLRYMSPEQALAKRVVVDHRTDVYSLGATLYEMLTLRPAFSGTDRAELLRLVAFEEPTAPRKLDKSIPPELETIVLKSMEKNPTDRLATAKDLADDLRRFLDDQPIQARRPALHQRLRKLARRHKAAVTAAVLCLVVSLAALAGSVGWVLGEQRARQRDAEARVLEALDAAAPGLREGNPHDPALIVAVQAAKAQRDAGAIGPELQARVEQLLFDQEMLERLETARLQKAAGSSEGAFDNTGSDQLYREAFQWYDLDVTSQDAEEGARRIRRSAIRTHLVVALDDWAFVQNQLHRGTGDSLRALADLADDDPWRKGLRQAITRWDRAALKNLAEAKGVLSQSSANLFILAVALETARPGEAAERLLRQAQAEHPADFWLNFKLAVTIATKEAPDLTQAVRFYQAAMALRPRSSVVYSNLSLVLAHQGQLAEAEATCRKAIKLQPDSAIAHNNLGVALSEQQKWAEAEAAHRKAIKLQPDHAKAHCNLGILLRRKGKFAEAEEALRQAIKLQPDDAISHYNLGILLCDRGKLEEAEAACRKAIKAHGAPGDIMRDRGWPTNTTWDVEVKAHCALADILQEQGKLENAEVACRKAIKLNPKFALGYHVLGIILQKRGKPVEAEVALRKSIALKPENANVHVSLGTVFKRAGKLREAELSWRQAIKLEPVCFMGHLNLGPLLMERGKLKEAEAVCRKAIELKPQSGEAHIKLAAVLSKRGKPEAAEAACRKAIELKPGFFEAFSFLGAVLEDRGKLEEAEAACRKAIKLRPDYAAAHENLGVVLQKRGKPAAAEAALRKSVELKPDDAGAHSNLGGHLRLVGKLREAEAACRQAIKLEPACVNAHTNLGSALAAQGKLEEAIAACRRAIELKPDHAPAYINLGLTLVFQEKLAEAEAAYRKAIHLKPDFAEAHCNLGQALRQQGRFAEALPELTRGHELGCRRPGWPYPSLRWIRTARRLVKLDVQLPKILSGEAQPGGTAEMLEVADMCHRYKKLHAAAARFYADAFDTQPKLLADDLGKHCYNAACSAALAGCGQGKDAANLSEKERVRWRQQALDWLRADLDAWGKRLKAEPDKARPVIVQKMRHWLADKDLAVVRGVEAIGKLPEAERQEWQKLWTDVTDLLAKAEKKTAPGKQSAKK